MKLSERCDKSNYLWRCFQIWAKTLGFDYFFIYSMQVNESLNAQYIPEHFLTNYPQNLLDYYIEEKFFLHDPVFRFSNRASYAVEWKSLNKNFGKCFSPNNRLMMNASALNGLKNGIVISVHSLDGSIQTISLSINKDEAISQDIMDLVTLTSAKMARAFRQTLPLNRRNNTFFSDREIECLSWVSIGKTSAEIACILGIQPCTVDFHLKNAMIKLDVNNRTMAAIKAYKIGLIHA